MIEEEEQKLPFWNKDACAFRIQMPQGYFPDFKLLAHHVEVTGHIYGK